MKRRDGIYLIIIAALVGALIAPVVSAQVGGFGDWAISEQSDSRIVLERDAVPTATAEATNTPVPPTATATTPPTATAVPPTATPTEPPSQDVGEWHAPADGHEHGDAPPQWVTDWSMDQFGHGLIYGGDEQTPNEWINKPRAFKGQVVTNPNGGGEGYVRYHGQANAVGRCAQYHSYEFYWLDTAGGVTFLQGHADFGNPDTRRFPRADGDPGQRPAMLVNDGRTPGLFEQWYGHGDILDIGISIGLGTTLFEADECDTLPDLGPFNNNYGLTRLVDGVLYEYRVNNRGFGWHCAAPDWFFDGSQSAYNPVTGECSNPDHIPQHIAPTVVDDMVVTFGLNRLDFRSQRSFGCPSCTLPN